MGNNPIDVVNTIIDYYVRFKANEMTNEQFEQLCILTVEIHSLNVQKQGLKQFNDKNK